MGPSKYDANQEKTQNASNFSGRFSRVLSVCLMSTWNRREAPGTIQSIMDIFYATTLSVFLKRIFLWMVCSGA